MNKVELEAKVDALTDEINFLRSLYEAVRSFLLLVGEEQRVVAEKINVLFPGTGKVMETWSLPLHKQK